MPIPLLATGAMMGLSALGGLFGNRSQTSKYDKNSTQDTTGWGTQNIDQLSAPQYDDLTGGLRNTLAAYYTNSVREDPDLRGYTTQGINNINQSYNLRKNVLNNILSQRGLTYSPAASTAQVGNEMSRIGEITNFRNQIPLLADQMKQQKLNDFSNFFKSLPVATRLTGRNTSDYGSHMSGHDWGTVTAPGNMLGGMFGSAGSALGGLIGAGAFNR